MPVEKPIPHANLSDRFLEFSVRIGKVVDALPRRSPVGRHVAGQLVRCGTSSAPNYEEACAVESRDDFTHKLRISLKEMRETRFWLRYIVHAELLPQKRMAPMVDESEQLCNILGKSLVTAKSNAGKSPNLDASNR